MVKLQYEATSVEEGSRAMADKPHERERVLEGDIHDAALAKLEKASERNYCATYCALVDCKIIGSHEHKIEGPGKP